MTTMSCHLSSSQIVVLEIEMTIYRFQLDSASSHMAQNFSWSWHFQHVTELCLFEYPGLLHLWGVIEKETNKWPHSILKVIIVDTRATIYKYKNLFWKYTDFFLLNIFVFSYMTIYSQLPGTPCRYTYIYVCVCLYILFYKMYIHFLNSY